MSVYRKNVSAHIDHDALRETLGIYISEEMLLKRFSIDTDTGSRKGRNGGEGQI